MTDQPTDTPEGAVEAPQIDADEQESFDREYVSKLRSENAERRTAATEAAKRADDLARQLHRALVEKTGRVADAADVEFNEEHLTNPEKLSADLDALLAAKPHYALRKPAPGSTIGQGALGSPVAPPPSLIDAIKAKQGK